MSKKGHRGKSRRREQIAKEKVARKAAMREPGGASTYAMKRLRAVRGTFSPTSPFCMQHDERKEEEDDDRRHLVDGE